MAYPNSTVIGFDPHPASLEAARKSAADQGLADRVSFELGTAQDFEGSFDLLCIFDALHDMGDPAVRAGTYCRRSRRAGR